MYYHLIDKDSFLEPVNFIVFSLKFILFIIYLLLASKISAQCIPTIRTNLTNDSQIFCQSDAPIELSVEEVVAKGIFIGQGITDIDSTDNKAIFDPSKVQYGNHTIGFVVLDGGKSPCQKGDNASLPIQILPSYQKNNIEEISICADGIQQVNLIDYLSIRVSSDGIWNTINGITPSSRSGTISSEQLQQLKAGAHLFTYTDPRYKDHTNCPTVAVKLNIIQPPSATKIDSVETVCEGDQAYVYIDGLADGYYTATYSIGLEEIPASEPFLAINGKALLMTTALSATQQQQPIYIKTITHTKNQCEQIVKNNRLIGKIKLQNNNYQ